MTLIDHLVELRSRLLKSLLSAGLGSIVALLYCRQIFNVLKKPMEKALLPESFFIATSPFESYMAYFKISLIAGFFLASPVLFYQFLSFISPALEKKEKRYLFPFTALSVLLFAGGALFGYFVVFPTGFHYMNIILKGTGITLLPKMSDYLNVALTLLLVFGLSFELPLMIFFLGKLDLIDYAFIRRNRRYVIVSLFILAAMLTPGPDVLSQSLLAIPLWILFEAGGLSLLLIKKNEPD